MSGEGSKPPNEIRISNERSQRVYITYIQRLFEGGPDNTGHEVPKYNDVTIRGMGRAITTVVSVVEILKRRIPGLHQLTTITSETMQDRTRGVDAPDDGERHEHKVSVIIIKLSKKPLDPTSVGYQPPLPADLVEAEAAEHAHHVRARRDRDPGRSGAEAPRRDRGGRGDAPRRRGYRADYYDDEPRRGAPRGGPRGRGAPRGGPRGRGARWGAE